VPSKRFGPRKILPALTRARVEFVLVGGLAGTAHGCAVVTYDVDIVCPRAEENAARLAKALRELGVRRPKLTHQSATYSTPAGRINVSIDADARFSYAHLAAEAQAMALDGQGIHVASIDDLIAMRATSGQTKDRLKGMELRLLSDVLRAPPTSG
jgi:hypothetical protein